MGPCCRCVGQWLSIALKALIIFKIQYQKNNVIKTRSCQRQIRQRKCVSKNTFAHAYFEHMFNIQLYAIDYWCNFPLCIFNNIYLIRKHVSQKLRNMTKAEIEPHLDSVNGVQRVNFLLNARLLVRSHYTRCLHFRLKLGHHLRFPKN